MPKYIVYQWVLNERELWSGTRETLDGGYLSVWG